MKNSCIEVDEQLSSEYGYEIALLVGILNKYPEASLAFVSEMTLWTAKKITRLLGKMEYFGLVITDEQNRKSVANLERRKLITALEEEGWKVVLIPHYRADDLGKNEYEYICEGCKKSFISAWQAEQVCCVHCKHEIRTFLSSGPNGYPVKRKKESSP